jgi:hypothetical protein
MEKVIRELVYTSFEKLIEKFNFQIHTESYNNRFFLIEFKSDKIIIKLEQYFRGIYVTLYRIDKPDFEINLYNLLDYLNQSNFDEKEDRYFENEKDLIVAFRKQLEYIASLLYKNYYLINDFFISGNYLSNFAEFDKYWRNKHPEFYKTI